VAHAGKLPCATQLTSEKRFIMPAQDNAALAGELYERFNRGVLDQAAALATDDVEVVLIPFGQTFHG